MLFSDGTVSFDARKDGTLHGFQSSYYGAPYIMDLRDIIVTWYQSDTLLLSQQ